MISEKLGLVEFRRRLVLGSFPVYSSLADALERLRFVQADPIRSPARAQDLMLRQRVGGYQAGDLEREYSGLEAEEGYLFAYGFMSPEVWHDLRCRPRAELSKRELEVLAVMKELGEVHPRGLVESVPAVWAERATLFGAERQYRCENALAIQSICASTGWDRPLPHSVSHPACLDLRRPFRSLIGLI